MSTASSEIAVCGEPAENGTAILCDGLGLGCRRVCGARQGEPHPYRHLPVYVRVSAAGADGL